MGAKPGTTESVMRSADQEGKQSVGKAGGNLKLKDPNQAHETLEITKNVP